MYATTLTVTVLITQPHIPFVDKILNQHSLLKRTLIVPKQKSYDVNIHATYHRVLSEMFVLLRITILQQLHIVIITTSEILKFQTF